MPLHTKLNDFNSWNSIIWFGRRGKKYWLGNAIAISLLYKISAIVETFWSCNVAYLNNILKFFFFFLLPQYASITFCECCWFQHESLSHTHSGCASHIWHDINTLSFAISVTSKQTGVLTEHHTHQNGIPSVNAHAQQWNLWNCACVKFKPSFQHTKITSGKCWCNGYQNSFPFINCIFFIKPGAIKTAYTFINCIFFIKPGAIKTAYTFINCIFLLNQGLSKQHTPL